MLLVIGQPSGFTSFTQLLCMHTQIHAPTDTHTHTHTHISNHCNDSEIHMNGFFSSDKSPKDPDGISNNEDPDQTARGAV